MRLTFLAPGAIMAPVIPLLVPLTVLVMEKPALSQERERSVLTGTVVSVETHQPLAAVLIELESQGVQTLTDSAGRFRLQGLAPIVDTVKATYFNLAAGRVPVDLTGAGPHEIDLALSGAAFNVADLVVRIRASPWAASQFANRIEGGLGQLVFYPEIRRRSTLRLMDFFRTVRRARVEYVNGEWRLFMRGLVFNRWCPPAVFMNGNPAPNWVLDATTVEDVLAIELYWEPNVPGEFKRYFGCGAVNVWTGATPALAEE